MTSNLEDLKRTIWALKPCEYKEFRSWFLNYFLKRDAVEDALTMLMKWKPMKKPKK